MREKVKGGLADGLKDSVFNKNNIRKGMKVEREHTSDPAIAREIAKDHLKEDPKYYQKLEKIEKKASAHRGNNMFTKGFTKVAVSMGWIKNKTISGTMRRLEKTKNLDFKKLEAAGKRGDARVANLPKGQLEKAQNGSTQFMSLAKGTRSAFRKNIRDTSKALPKAQPQAQPKAQPKAQAPAKGKVTGAKTQPSKSTSKKQSKSPRRSNSTEQGFWEKYKTPAMIGGGVGALGAGYLLTRPSKKQEMY